MKSKIIEFAKHFLIPLILTVGTLIVHSQIYTSPRNWYDHYLHLANSLIEGRVDLPTLPSYYHDKVEFNGKTYIPFPPGASFLLMPFVLLNSEITQQQVSILIGAINIGLLYLLLRNFTKNLNAALLSIFFALGTVHFWSSVVGTTWYFAHIVSIFFILISLNLHFKEKNFLSGIFFALASLTRLPMVLSGIFFLLRLGISKKLFKFLLGAFIFIPIILGYNYLRFGNIFENGYNQVYLQYANTSYPYTIWQILNSGSYVFGYFDIKNLPMHFYTFLAMPPDIEISSGIVNNLKPSPFGMGILFTSPLLLLAIFSKIKDKLQLQILITVVLTMMPSFLHVMQGWVQFGYRFILDAIVFLMMILAILFKPTKLNLILIAISVIVNFWGVLWGIRLGW